MLSLYPTSLNRAMGVRGGMTTLHRIGRVASVSPSNPTPASVSSSSSTTLLLSSIFHPSAAIAATAAIRHGHSSSQSYTANRASSRASGSTYRTPKGRPGPNTYHWTMKEPLPDVRRFADAKLPKHARRKKRAEDRKKLSRDDRIDFTILDGKVVPLNGSTTKAKRTKTALHKTLRRQRAERDAAASTEAGMEWNEDEQRNAEEEALQFLQAESERITRERQQLIEETEGMDEEERIKLIEEFDQHSITAVQEKLDAMDFSSSASAVGDSGAASETKLPTFGIQTVLKFLKEFNLEVKPPATKKKGKKGNDAMETIGEDDVDDNPLNQDILVYDVITRFNFADHIVVVKAQSARQMRHLAESSYKMARSLNACSANPRVLSLEGRGREDWMLVDCGFIWMYFFNKNPVVNLPNAQGIFGVSFHVPTPSVNIQASRGHKSDRDDIRSLVSPTPLIGVGQAALVSPVHDTESVTFHSSVNPFDPTGALKTPAIEHEEDASHDDVDENESTPAEFELADVSDGHRSHSIGTLADDGELRLQETTSSQINSTMWYEPTPDSRTKQKKSQINAAQQRQQMLNTLDDAPNTRHKQSANSSSSSSQTVIDATSYTAASTPFQGSIDPSLALLHASNFTHPVLENLEKTYGDLRIPTEKVAKLKDYQHEDLRNDVAHIQSETETATTKGKGRRKKKGAESIEIQDMTTSIVSGSLSNN